MRKRGRGKLKKLREKIPERSLPTATWQGLGMKDTRICLPRCCVGRASTTTKRKVVPERWERKRSRTVCTL